MLHDDGLRTRLAIDGEQIEAAVSAQGAQGWLDAGGICAPFIDLTDLPPQREDPFSHGLVASRMHGQLVKLDAALGQRVSKGEFLLAIEAMKMEHRIESPIDGTVVEVGAAAGAQVAPGQVVAAHRGECLTPRSETQ